MMRRILNKLYYKLIEKCFEEDVFPASPIASWKINFKLKETLKELENRDIKNLVGELYNLPNPVAANT